MDLILHYLSLSVALCHPCSIYIFSAKIIKDLRHLRAN